MTPPAPDPRCPTVTAALPIPLVSCCATNGMCGLDASMLGMGCVDFAGVRASPFGALLMVPDPVSCDGSSVDAGTEDAGR